MVSVHSNLAEEVKRVIFTLLILTGFSVGMVMLAGTDEDEAEKALNNWIKIQSGLKTWKADFTQTRTFPTLSNPLVSNGTVFYQEPGMFRWVLGDPPRTIAWRTRDKVTVYYPLLKRAEVYSLGSDTPGMWRDILSMLDAGFSRERKELESQFEIIAVSKQGEVGRVEMKPKNAMARRLMTSLVIEFSPEVPGPTATEFFFADGTRMRNDFQNSVVNPELDPEYWDPKLPPDVRIQQPLSK